MQSKTSLSLVDQETLVIPLAHRRDVRASWHVWLIACQRVLPIYIAIHVACAIITYVAVLFTLGNFSTTSLPLHTLLNSWFRWDSGHFTFIATHGYDGAWRTAFFPLYPILEHIFAYGTQDPFIAGLIVSNLAGFGLFVVLYRLIVEDFDADLAHRTVLYLAVFPTAFFFLAAYNESLFIFLATLSFYHIRRGSWWLAGMAGILASLTRSAGLLLLVPFAYEYLRQHNWNIRAFRLDVLSMMLIPAGTVLFAIYCNYRFHDPFAFSHAQAVWHRYLVGTWYGFGKALKILLNRSVLTFDSIHTVIDLSTDTLMLALVILGFVGPWRFSHEQMSYALYGLTIYLFLTMFPAVDSFPLQSLSRLVLEMIPAFVTLALIGKRSSIHLGYLLIAWSFFAFMLLQFLTGRWVV
jgi:hypothetical protein